MKRIFSVMAALLVVFVLAAPAMAADDAPVAIQSVLSDTNIMPGEILPVEDRTTLISALEDILGPYSPRTQTVISYMPDGSSVTSEVPISGLSGLDVSWLAGCVFLGIFLVGIIKLIGVILRNG